MVEMVEASAPGKVILFGEHFVVKGTRSLASAISLRVSVAVRRLQEGPLRVYSDRAGVHGDTVDLETLATSNATLKPLAALIRYLRDEYDIKPLPATVNVKSSIPIGAGLGSSAAFAAAFALAYARLAGVRLELDDIWKASFESEKVAHGRPSGIDNTLAVYGGSILYRPGFRGFRLDIGLPEGYQIVIANTGVPRSTRDVVRSVLDRAERTWEASKYVYEAADKIVGLALDALRKGDVELLADLMELNQGLLYGMGASSIHIERLLYAARSAGALAAKLTGAGRGGCVIVLAREPDVGRIVSVLRGEGATEVFPVSLGSPGVRLEREE